MDHFNPVARVISTILRFLTYLFITLRACNIVDWAWYLVLSPALISFGVWLLFCMVLGIAAASRDGV